MRTKTWRKLFATGFVVSAFAAGCVITSDDDDDGDGGSGGTSGSGGSAGRGGGGSGGKAGTGGTAGTGGGGGKVSCSDPIDVDDAGQPNTCQECIQQDCCAEYLECFNDDPDCAEQFVCVQDCIIEVVKAGDPVTTQVKDTCISECDAATNVAMSNLFGCVDLGEKGDAAAVDGCSLECLEGEPI